jgi:hypothetical protein
MSPGRVKNGLRALAAPAKRTARPRPKRAAKTKPVRRAKLQATFDAILANLLAAIEATGTTLRLDDATLGFSVADVAGEARLASE